MSHCLVVPCNREGSHTIGGSTPGFATLRHKLYTKHIQLQELYSKKCGVGINSTNFVEHTPGIDVLYVLIWLQGIYLPLPLFTEENFSSVTPPLLYHTTQSSPHGCVLAEPRASEDASRASRNNRCAIQGVQVIHPPWHRSHHRCLLPPPTRPSRSGSCPWSRRADLSSVEDYAIFELNRQYGELRALLDADIDGSSGMNGYPARSGTRTIFYP
jgi:hypothetical protein